MDKKLLQERLQEIEESLGTVKELGSIDEDILNIMEELLEATKVKNKLCDYLD